MTAVPAIAVVVATHNRRQLLSARCLPSVAGQTRIPDFLVVVDDSSDDYRQKNRAVVDALNLSGCQIAYLENQRTGGASGAWNTALEFLAEEASETDQLFVAFLDDDDSWSRKYVETCLTAACEGQLDMVAADILRYGVPGRSPALQKAPEELQADDFLVGNPGIQGSNLFVRLSVLLAAGQFDEALPSSTDRDLCIRIAELGHIRYDRVNEPLVNHFADPDRSRLSKKGCPAKLGGLSMFWQKYHGRMTAEQRLAFSRRAQALFAWEAPAQPARELPEDSGGRRRCLVLGLICSSEQPGELLALADQLGQCLDKTVVGFDVVLLERPAVEARSEVAGLVATRLRDLGLGCFLISAEQQQHARRLGFSSHLGAANAAHQTGRLLLSTYCDRIAETRKGTEVWIAAECENASSDHDYSIEIILGRLGAERSDRLVPVARHLGEDMVAKLDDWILADRVATAESRVRRLYPAKRIRLLGHGSEAVVFTDGKVVYKCIDYWKTRMPRSHFEFLRQQVGQWKNVPGLYEIRTVMEDGCCAVLTYDYEESRPYEGGFEDDLVRLLDGCCVAGVVCNNVHPKNLVVTPGGIKLVDYGSDVRPWSQLGLEHMARRAYLCCKHASHPELESLMRHALVDSDFPEMVGYSSFRRRLVGRYWDSPLAGNSVAMTRAAPECPPISLHVGVITSDPYVLRPLLLGLGLLQGSLGIRYLDVLVLDNGCPPVELEQVLRPVRDSGLRVAVVSESQQKRDAADGTFGRGLCNRPPGQVSIALARTMLQKYLGTVLRADAGSFGWLLDDDMRVDARAEAYLSWLPAFRQQGVAALIGAYEGASPNPPLNGIRVHLVDFLHNMLWLRRLDGSRLLPDRSAENAVLRRRFPDYYYDLSRKHTGHLEMPHWLTPAVPGELVREAYSRLVAGALGILKGEPLSRPIVADVPANPLESAKDSVNRGGCTFILDHHTLTEAPNTILRFQGKEARRSDMMWAIVNRYYRRRPIKAVGFPVYHVGRVLGEPELDIAKVQGEIVGSTLYAGLTDYLRKNPHHRLNFTESEGAEVSRLVERHLHRRLQDLERSFQRIMGVREALRSIARPGELEQFLDCLDEWFTYDTFRRIRSGVVPESNEEVRRFLTSLRTEADEFASEKADVGFIEEQMGM